MRRIGFLLLIILSLSVQLLAQEQNVTVLGRWADGRNEAIFRRGGITFTGNGAYLEAYKTGNTDYGRLDRILLSGEIRDIWVKGDTTHVFVACGDSGLQVVYFDYQTRRFLQIIAKYQTPGTASGVTESNGYTYLADGAEGLLVLYTGIPSNPQFMGNYETGGFAHELWIQGSTVYVGAGSAGLFSIDVSNPENPVRLDQLAIPVQFPAKPDPEVLSVLVPGADTLAYVSSGWGGMQIINIKNPENLFIETSWPRTGIPIFVQDTWVTGQYAHLACRDKGLFTQIDISDHNNITGPVSFALDTPGDSKKIVVEADTAYAIDSHNGHLLVDVNINNSPTLLQTIQTADRTYDVAVYKDYIFAATGLSGLKIFPVQSNYNGGLLHPMSGLDTEGEARGIFATGAYTYVADGSDGVKIIDTSDRNNPILSGQYNQFADTCYDVAVPAGSYLFTACGHDGVHVLDYSDLNAVWQAFHLDTDGSARNIQISGDEGIVADSSSVIVYEFTGLPGIISNVDEIGRLTSAQADIEALAVDVSGETIVIANGRYGILVWHRQSGRTDAYGLGGNCTDVRIIENTIYATVENRGIQLVNYSLDGEFTPIGGAATDGLARALDVSSSGNRIWVAAERGGLYDMESSLKPQISVIPEYLDFGSVPPGFERTLNVQIQNPGTKDLMVSRIQLVGLTTAFAFSETAFVVPPGESKRLFVTFSPPLLGASSHVATASIYSNAVPSPVTLFLQGEGSTPSQEEPYENDVFTSGLWHLDEGSGNTNINDVSGNNLTGQTFGNVSREEGKTGFNRSVRFLSSGAGFTIPNDALLNISQTSFTLELWFSMLERQNGRVILVKRGMGSTQQIAITLNGSGDYQGLAGHIWDIDGLEYIVHSGDLDDINLNQWYHAALSWDGDSLRLHMNGRLQDRVALQGNLRSETTQSLVFGSDSEGNNTFIGQIDEIRLSNIARQSWEFNVSRSRLVINRDPVQFGSILVDENRRLPLVLQSQGEEDLTIYGVSATDNAVSVSTSSGFILASGRDSTIWLTYRPEVLSSLDDNASLVIASNDATYPFLEIPLTGRAVETVAAGTHRTDPFTLGLYHFEEVEETTVFDSSGYGFHADLQGGVLLDTTNGKFDQYLWFDGVAEYCSVDSLRDPILGPIWGGFTAEAWTYLNALPTDSSAIVLSRGGDDFKQFDIRINARQNVIASFWNRQGEKFVVSSDTMQAIIAGQWYHIAAVYDAFSGVLKLYVNGQLIDQGILTGELSGKQSDDPVHGSLLVMGGDSGAQNPLLGLLDEVRLSGIARQPWEFNVNQARSAVSPAWIDFGKVLVGHERIESYWVSNPGLDPLIVNDLVIQSENDGFFSTNVRSFQLNPGQKQQVFVTYTPESKGTHEAVIRMSSNNLFPDQTVHLQGVCIDSTEGGSYTSDPQTLSLIHFEAGGDTTIVTSGNVMWSDTSRFGTSSLRFLGGFAELNIDTTLDLSVQHLTLEMWFSLASMPTSTFTLLQWGGETGSITWRINAESGRGFEILIKDADNETFVLPGLAFNRLNLNQWYHVAMVWNGQTLTFLINNIQYASIVFDGNLIIPRGAPVRLGSDYSGEGSNFLGWIDEMRFSGTARQSWEYNVSPPSLVLSTNRLSFSTVPLGQSRIRSFSMTNHGDQDLIINRITPSDTVFSVPAFTDSVTIPRNGIRTFDVMFQPQIPDTAYESNLLIFSNDTSVVSRIITLSARSLGEKRNEPFAEDDPYTLALYHFNRDTTHGDSVLWDYSGRGLHGQIHNATWTSNGLYGEALHFDGYRDWISILSHESFVFNLSLDVFTIEFSMKTDTISSRQWLVSKGVDDTLHYGMYLNKFGILTIPGFGSGGPLLSDGRWHQIAFVYNPVGNSIMYIDGKMILSRAWIHNGVDVGYPVLIGALKSKNEGVGGFFQGQIDEFRISNVMRNSWEVKLGDYGIEIANVSTQIPVISDSLILAIDVPVKLNPDSVWVYFRAGGGLNAYSRLSAQWVNNGFRVTIPPEFVGLNGFEYYVDVLSQAGQHYTEPGFAAAQNPLSLKIRHRGLDSRVSFYNQRFTESSNGSVKKQTAALFSIPTELNFTRPDSALKELMPYDPFEWRLFWWHSAISQDRLDNGQTSVYLEYPQQDPGFFNFTPGRAFWLVTKTEKEFRVPGGISMPTDSLFEVQLNIGWTMIASPYPFAVAWDDCIIMGSDLIKTLYAWDGDNGFRTNVSHFNPWEGYFVYNPDTVTAKLLIPAKESVPDTASASLAKFHKNHIAYAMEENEWLVQFDVESRGVKDRSNFVGVRKMAAPELDSYDQIEPPPSPGDQVRLYFENLTWETGPAQYTTDIRRSGEAGYSWDLILKTPYSETPFTVSWSCLKDVPEGWGAYLFDLVEGTSVNLLEQQQLTRRTDKKASSYPSRLVIGSPEYIENNREGFSLVPVEFALDQNYPNPFNPETTIQYSLPKAGKAVLTIFNVLGRKVTTIQLSHDTAGHYRFVWTGRNDAGAMVASGVYFYKLQAPDHVATKKMVVIR